MKRIGLRAYVIFSFIVFGVMIAVMTAGLWLASDEIESTAVNMNDAVESITAAQNILDRLEANRRRTLLTTSEPDPAVSDRLRSEMRQDLLGSLKPIELYVDGDEERQTVQDVRASVDRFLALYQKPESKKLYGARLYLFTAGAFDQAVSDISHLIRINQNQAHDFEVQAKVMSETYKDYSLAFWLVVLTSSLLLFWMFYRLVWSPIYRLRQAIEAYTSSKRHPSDPIRGLTEIGEISEKFRDLTLTLQRQNEQRLMFLAAVAHDLKNPLAAMKMSLDLLMAEGHDAQIHAVLGRQMQQLQRLVDDLLDAARVESGNLELQRERFDLCEIVNDCVTLFQSVSVQHTIRFDGSAEEMPLVCDRHRLSQVFNNILSNAIKYSPDGGDIDVSLKRVGDFAVVAVRDHGIGIDGGAMQSIFEPFRRPHANHHRISGVGLGLSTSKKIIEAHRGWIQVQSAKGEGAVFFVALPLSERANLHVPPVHQMHERFFNLP